jgi:hypothetical protein
MSSERHGFADALPRAVLYELAAALLWALYSSKKPEEFPLRKAALGHIFGEGEHNL